MIQFGVELLDLLSFRKPRREEVRVEASRRERRRDPAAGGCEQRAIDRQSVFVEDIGERRRAVVETASQLRPLRRIQPLRSPRHENARFFEELTHCGLTHAASSSAEAPLTTRMSASRLALTAGESMKVSLECHARVAPYPIHERIGGPVQQDDGCSVARPRGSCAHRSGPPWSAGSGSQSPVRSRDSASPTNRMVTRGIDG